jgi:radical SAM superfamily enzyme YgiQ (UPF0313 family)
MHMISGNHLDALFIFAPGGENANNYFYYHTGSSYIISFLRFNGYKAGQFICDEYINIESCVKKILTHNARIIGFTVFNTNFITSVLLAERIKTVSPTTLIVFGGPTASTFSEYILNKYPFVDVCFRNESEEIFLQFVSQLTDSNFDFRKIDPLTIKGISHKEGEKICHNPESNTLIQNSATKDYLDKYPSPYLSGVIPGSAAFNTGLITARGCNQNCVYCNCAVLSKRRFFTHSTDRVIAEIDFIAGHSSENLVLSIFDDAFSLIPQRAKKICRAIIENNIKIQLSCITRCDCIDEELLNLMREAGFVAIGFSLESANPETLRTIGKVHKPEDKPSDGLAKELFFLEKFHEVSSYAKKIGIKNVFSSVMVGLPNETVEGARKTIETIENNENIDSYTHNLLNIYEGTPLASTFSDYGYKLELIDHNPIFSKTVYPDERIKQLDVSPKSQNYKAQTDNDKNALKILSLGTGKKSTSEWVYNIIFISDTVNRNFIDWLKKILAINGTIIQIYSNEATFLRYSSKNYGKFIKYSLPTDRIQNYYIEKNGNLLLLNSYTSAYQRSEYRKSRISICNFNYLITNFNDSRIDFLKMLCKESDIEDANLAYDYFCEISKANNIFDYLISRRAYPYFANLCKWTKSLSNCRRWNTLIVNEKSEVRLCWSGTKIGTVGQSYNEMIENFKSIQKKLSGQRKCHNCNAEEYCIKCISPCPVSDIDYCNMQKDNNITQVSEIVTSLDLFKKYM